MCFMVTNYYAIQIIMQLMIMMSNTIIILPFGCPLSMALNGMAMLLDFIRQTWSLDQHLL